MPKLLDVWRLRHLTLFGKIAIIKSLAIPSLIFSATMLTTPTDVVKQINKLLYGFIGKKHDRISRKTLIAPLEEGGLGMIDIQSQFDALKAAWVPHFLKDFQQEVPWTFLADKYFNCVGPNKLILNMTFLNPKAFYPLTTLPMFYQEIILSFNKNKYTCKPTPENVQNQLCIAKPTHFWLIFNAESNGQVCFLSSFQSALTRQVRNWVV
jgi:hypothetical protein